MEKLTCNDCKVVYTEEADIKLAKGMQKDYKEMCQKDKVIPKGICPCPNVVCTGELILSVV